METNKNYFMVGLFAIVTVVAGLIFTVWLTASGQGDMIRYRIRFAESVSGLSIGGAVKFRGVDVGQVESILIDPEDDRLVRVDIKVLKSTPIKPNTFANLKLQGITGMIYVELAGGTPEQPLLADVTTEGAVPEIRAQQSSIDAIVNRLPELLEKATAIADQITKLINDDNVQAVGDIIARWKVISTSLEKNTKQLDTLLGSSNAAAANLSRSSEQGEGLVRDLRKTSRHMSRLSESLEEDPSRLIFPDKEKGIPAP